MQKALYRAFRPQTFEEVVGQEPIVKALKNQIETGRIAHAYLFSGTRGTGKTSCAKIFARAVNCLEPVDGSPCNHCANCRSILEETTMDVVEMDAASNRRIDDIRDLRETVKYPPAQLRYKVYIIDEAHMITNEGFNALLKIMEEPPDHLIFILATTEAEKIPQTILSRVQRYEFKRLDVPVIAKQLAKVAGALGLEVEEEALQQLALAADGAMRDGLSLLDQARTLGNKITAQAVQSLLGTVGKESMDSLTDAILHDRLVQAMTYAQDLLAKGKEVSLLLKEWMEYFRYLLLLKSLGDQAKLDLSKPSRDRMEEIIADVSMQRILDSIEILADTDQLLKKSNFADTLFLSSLVRLVNYRSKKEILSRLEALERKLSLVERWQSPETQVAQEVAKQLAAMEPQLEKKLEIAAPLAEEAPPALVAEEPALESPAAATSDPVAAASAPAADGPSAADGLVQLFKQKEGEWRRLLVEKGILHQAMLGRYRDLEAQGSRLVFYYPEGDVIFGILQRQVEPMQALLSDLLGQEVELLLQAGPGQGGAFASAGARAEGTKSKGKRKKQASASATASAAAKASQDPNKATSDPASAEERKTEEDPLIELLRQRIDPKILTIRD